jgi:hypothetical protein
MAIPEDVLTDTMGHIGGTELTSKSAPKAIGHESDFVKEQVVLALEKEPGLQQIGDIRVSVTDDEILLAASWTREDERALGEHRPLARRRAGGTL